MKNRKKMLAVMATLALVAVSVRAEVPKGTRGRVDINAEKAKIILIPESKECKGVNLFNPKWRKDKKDFNLSGIIYFKNDVWQKAKIVFTPKESGKAKLYFLGAYNAKKEQEKWFKYTNIKINGEPIILNDKGWILIGGAEFITSKGPDGKDIKCVRGKCHSAATYKLRLKKDHLVTIEFDVKYDQ